MAKCEEEGCERELREGRTAHGRMVLIHQTLIALALAVHCDNFVLHCFQVHDNAWSIAEGHRTPVCPQRHSVRLGKNAAGVGGRQPSVAQFIDGS
jgi:hypothetical protein